MAYGTVNVDAMTTSDGVTSAGTYGFKNRIINGAMVIDQRNAGASYTVPSGGGYTLDRWSTNASQASKYTVQQSSTAPTGFVSSAKLTSSSAYSLAAGDYFQFQQYIEGYNTADLGFGTANAKTVTLSFWVQSSLTGQFGLFLINEGTNRIYPTSYTINSANTWEQKTITLSGDTSGTWNTTNGTGLRVTWTLGYGSTYSGATPNVWGNTGLFVPSGCVNFVGTNGATFYITGVQLEKGSTATSFDYRPFGTELVLCERYYQIIDGFAGIANSGGTSLSTMAIFPVTMRASPSVGTTASLRITDPSVADYSQSSGNAAIVAGRVSSSGIQANLGNFTGLTQRYGYQHNIGSNSITLSAEL